MKYLDPKNDLILRRYSVNTRIYSEVFWTVCFPLAEGQEIIELEYLSPEMIPETFLEKFTKVDVYNTTYSVPDPF